MKKLFEIFTIACMMLLSTQLVFANADKATIIDDTNLMDVHRMAIAAPLYTPNKGEPSSEELWKTIAAASNVTRGQVVPYDTVVQNIQQDANVNILSLDRRQAAKAYRDHVAKYADAYVVTTVANDAHLVFFFDVYQAGTNKLIYSYQIVGSRADGRGLETYKVFAEQFYKNFDRSAQNQQSERDKASKKKK